ncbi:lipopolysaccharide biosynthesis protein [Methanolobus chelungpuianus]|uniref:Lipopolysaccharide biosynthesis protein n=1 Tax=Methanolobus chelungpuianus TaxID=502115 RepID=A0AAE3HAI3_9EURY|nr:lipopolysaccharide biosynthesis protein [Methanolobus chelungpuianus]MCQ6962761.1 hypothetical protein [Methanolobus chelungpuianus]
MSIAKKAVHGIAWVTLTALLIRIFETIAQLVLARLLDPADFGLIAIGLLAINTMSIFRDMGFGAALIHRKEDPDYIAANTSFILIPIFATILLVIAYFSAPYMAVFFDNSEVSPIIRVLALTFLISSFGTVPSILLEKELEFKKKVIPETLPRLGYAIVAILFAFYGYGVWSLVYGQITSAVLTTALIWIVSDWRPHLMFDKNVTKELFKYGKHILGASIIIFLITNVDDALVGRVLGIEELGFYTLAYTISNLPATQITHLIGRVMFPTYSKLQHDIDKLKSIYLKSITFISMLSIPTSIGILLIAPSFITFILGEKWTPAIPALQILCFYGLFRSIAATSGSLFQAIGKPIVLMKTSIMQLVLMLLLFPVFYRYGITGISVAVTIPLFIITLLQLHIITTVLKISLNDIASILAFNFSSAFFMVIWFVVADSVLLSTLNEKPIIKMSSLIITSVVIYFLSIYILNKKSLEELKTMFKSI